MKKILFYFILNMTLFLSCEKQGENKVETFDSSIDDSPELVVTKAEYIESYSDFLVSKEDIDAYVRFFEMDAKTFENRGRVIQIDSVMYEGELSYYVLNYESGWDLISSDKRGPIVLGRSDAGRFNYKSMNPGQQAWLSSLSDDIYFRRHFDGKYYDKDIETIKKKESSCIEFWLMVTANPDYVSLFNSTTTKIGPQIDDSGHWEVYNQYSIETVEDSGHLLSTRWHQKEPFNLYCPYKSGSTIERAPAGCVAIAAAQEMFYLHNKIGKPVYSPSSGLCVGDIDSYTQYFDDFVSSAWGNMNFCADPYGYAAMLIGCIGWLLDMDYGDDGSSADSADLPDLVFEPNGIDCTRCGYDSDLLFDSLLDEIPVILSAYCYDPALGFLPWFSGHCFVCDRIQQTVTRYYTTYTFIYDNQGVVHPLPPDNYTVQTSVSRELDFIGMNWGQHPVLNYDYPLYSPEGAWNETPDNNYHILRKMIYNFN